MILLALVGLLIVGWIFSIVVKLPIRIYSALNGWIRSTLILSSCGICNKRWADLTSDEGTYSHTTTETYNALVSQDVEWDPCTHCDGTGSVRGGARSKQVQSGDGYIEIENGFYSEDCPKCGRSGGKERIVNQEFEERTRETRYYHYVISCGDCAGKYTLEDIKKPTFPNNKRTIFIANIINQGLVKGMLAGLVLALSGTVIWGMVELVNQGFSFPSFADWIMGFNILLGTAVIALLIAIPIGGLWGAIIFFLSPAVTLLAKKDGYLHCALSGGLSLALLIAVTDLFSETFNTVFTSFLYAILGYLIIICVGAIASCAAKPMLNHLEKTL